MNKKKRILGILTLVMSIFLSSCGPRQLFGPTFTPTPTLTPTSTSTATPDPCVSLLQEANRKLNTQNYEQALAEYGLIIQQCSTYQTVINDAYEGMADIAVEYLRRADEQNANRNNHEDGHIACETYKQANTVYETILTNPNKPDNNLDQIHLDAARVSVALIDCYMFYEEPGRTPAQIFDILLTNIGLHTDSPDAQNILISSIFKTYQQMVIDSKYNDSQQDIVNIGQMLMEEVGNHELDGQKLADLITIEIVRAEVCAGDPVTLSNVGTSMIRRGISCESQDYLLQDGLLANAPSEIWFVLQVENVSEEALQCTGYSSDTGKNFYYSYYGKMTNTYLLRDVHTGAVTATRIFWGTSPRCVFTRCSINTFTNTATCTGGEGQSTFDKEVLIQWLKDNLK